MDQSISFINDLQSKLSFLIIYFNTIIIELINKLKRKILKSDY